MILTGGKLSRNGIAEKPGKMLPHLSLILSGTLAGDTSMGMSPRRSAFPALFGGRLLRSWAERSNPTSDRLAPGSMALSLLRATVGLGRREVDFLRGYFASCALSTAKSGSGGEARTPAPYRMGQRLYVERRGPIEATESPDALGVTWSAGHASQTICGDATRKHRRSLTVKP